MRPIETELRELADMSGAELAGANRTVLGATLRAQHATTGDLFAALPGRTVHGAQFAADAVAEGAVAVLTDARGLALLREHAATADIPVLVHDDPRSILGTLSARIYGDPSRRLTLIGITGTSGKTTTAYLTEAALRAAGRGVGLIGTVEIRIDGTRVPSSLTTPEAPDLQRLFAVMLERGVDTVVMEVSSHALSLGRVDGADFAIGGFTNLSQDHLDFHHTMDEYFDAKARLFDGAAPTPAAQALICVDDEAGERMAEVARRSAERVATVSTTGRADWWVNAEISADPGSQTVLVTDPGGAEHVLTVPLPGAYNVANALLAVGLAAVAGVPPETAIGGLAAVAVPGRLEKVDRGQDFLAVVDYAHKPAAVEAVLATLTSQTAGRVAVVLGAGGDRDTEKRPLMGAAAARGADLVIITDDNPRSEDPAAIRAAVYAGAAGVPAGERRAADIVETGDRAQAIADAVAWAGTGDVVLVAGKGHETGQEVAGTKYPFDDRDVLARALERAGTDDTGTGDTGTGDTGTGDTGAGDTGVGEAGAEEAGAREADRAGRDGLVVYVADHAGLQDAKSLVRTVLAEAADLGVGSAHRTPGADAADGRRTWVVFGEFTDMGAGQDENARAVAHDLLGRLAVRLAVDQTVAVGATRAARALYQGAIQEGSWGEEAGFYESTGDLLAHLREEAGTPAVPRAGDVVLVAGGSGLTGALVAHWRADPALDVTVHTR